MFETLRVKNFRAFRDSGAVPLAPLTVVVGQNNAGKSSLLNSLFLLKQTLDDQTGNEALVTSGPVDLGSFDDIVRAPKSPGGRKHLSIALTVPTPLVDRWAKDGGMPRTESDPPFEIANELDVTFSFDPDVNIVRVESTRFSRDGEPGVAARWSKKHGELRASPASKAALPIHLRHFLPTLGLPPDRPEDFDLRMRHLLAVSDSVSQAQAWAEAIGAVEHIAPLRLPIPRLAILGRTSPADLSSGGDKLLQLLRTLDDRPSDRNRRDGDGVLGDVNYWISERLEMLKRLHLLDIDKSGQVLALLADERKGLPNINIANMGEGVSQLLPIILSVLLTPPGGCLLVEQPEIHLHPAAQARLADLFIEPLDGLGGPQFIVETHSEHFLLRLRRRIAEQKLDPAAVQFLYVDKPGPDARAIPLELDASGHFKEWPEGFFEEGYEEAMRLAEAAAARQ